MKTSVLCFLRWSAAVGVLAVTGLLAFCVCGCSSPAVSEPKYPEYDKWWASSEPRRRTDLSELGQGDILVFDNGQEATLL